MSNNGFPEVIFEKKVRIPGIFLFSLLTEDRRPDLINGKDNIKIHELGYKFKHTVEFRVFRFSFYGIFRTINRPYFKINGKEQ